MRKALEAIVFWVITYPSGVGLALIFKSLEYFGVIKIHGRKNFPDRTGKNILCSNHPTLIDQFYLIPLFGATYLTSPLKLRPWTVADASNFFQKWYMYPWRQVMISVDRNNRRSGLWVLEKMTEIIISGGNVINFLEGGRTKTNPSGNFQYSRHFRRLRGNLKLGPARAVIAGNGQIVPCWIEHKMLVLFTLPKFIRQMFPKRRARIRIPTRTWIAIGKPITPIDGESAISLTNRIAIAILDLADTVP